VTTVNRQAFFDYVGRDLRSQDDYYLWDLRKNKWVAFSVGFNMLSYTGYSKEAKEFSGEYLLKNRGWRERFKAVPVREGERSKVASVLAFNKYNPPELFSQLVAVLEGAGLRAEAQKVRAVSEEVIKAWNADRERTSGDVMMARRIVSAAEEKTWRVYLDKAYAAPEDRPKGVTSVLAETYVKAKTREEAAQKAWREKRNEWLKLCTFDSGSKLPRRISLFVGEKGSVTGAASRLTPIRVEG